MRKILNVKPIFDSLIVKQLETKKETDSGIIIPESSQKKQNVYKVIAIGPDCKSGVKEGNYVILSKNLQVTTEIEVNGSTISIVKEENIIAIIEIDEIKEN